MGAFLMARAALPAMVGAGLGAHDQRHHQLLHDDERGLRALWPGQGRAGVGLGDLGARSSRDTGVTRQRADPGRADRHADGAGLGAVRAQRADPAGGHGAAGAVAAPRPRRTASPGAASSAGCGIRRCRPSRRPRPRRADRLARADRRRAGVAGRAEAGSMLHAATSKETTMASTAETHDQDRATARPGLSAGPLPHRQGQGRGLAGRPAAAFRVPRPRHRAAPPRARCWPR